MKNIKKRWNVSVPWEEGIAGEVCLLAIWKVCYDDWFWLFLLQPLLYFFITYQKQRKKKRQKEQVKQAFQSMLQSLMTSLQAGYALENACKIATEEVNELYPIKHPIHNCVRILERGIALQMPAWKLFYNMAEESQVEEIYQFAVVLEIISQTGGNLVEIIRNTIGELRIKMDAEEEIRVLISGKLLEKNIMLLMPFFILLYLRWLMPSYLSVFYNNVAGHLVMSILLGIILGCFYWTERIINQCI